MTETTVLIVSDLQVPYHDGRALENLLAFTKDFQPDRLVNVGDDLDAPEVSHWHKSGAGEYAGTLQASLDQVAQIHASFREALGDGRYDLSRSNHGERLRQYIARYAPALAGLRSLDLEDLAGYKAAGIEYHTRPFEVAPGWVCAHGDEGSLSGIAGRTASLLAQKWGASVVCGHTHRAGLVPSSTGFGGVVDKTLWGFEVGHLMDMKQAPWLRGGHANWQQAFGILRVRGIKVSAELVPIHHDGSFVVDGKWYGLPEPTTAQPFGGWELTA